MHGQPLAAAALSIRPARPKTSTPAKSSPIGIVGWFRRIATPHEAVQRLILKTSNQSQSQMIDHVPSRTQTNKGNYSPELDVNRRDYGKSPIAFSRSRRRRRM
jgi:hypothetical protein